MSFAPHTGAWIETSLLCGSSRIIAFAPHTGAWIETKSGQEYAEVLAFAPHTGAWIETIADPKNHWLAIRTPHGCVD